MTEILRDNSLGKLASDEVTLQLIKTTLYCMVCKQCMLNSADKRIVIVLKIFIPKLVDYNKRQ